MSLNLFAEKYDEYGEVETVNSLVSNAQEIKFYLNPLLLVEFEYDRSIKFLRFSSNLKKLLAYHNPQGEPVYLDETTCDIFEDNPGQTKRVCTDEIANKPYSNCEFTQNKGGQIRVLGTDFIEIID